MSVLGAHEAFATDRYVKSGGGCTGSPCYTTVGAAIAASVAGDVIHLESNIAEGIISVNIALTIDGHGYTITSTSSPNYGIEVAAAGVTIQNLTVFDATTFGIQVDCDAHNLTLTNVTVNSSGGTGIGINGSDNVTLTNITSTNNVGNGISITDCNNLTINGITTSGNAYSPAFSAGIGLFTSGVYCPPAGISDFELIGAVSIGEPVKVYSGKANAADVIAISPTSTSIQWAVGTSAVDRSYWPDKATAYAVVDALFETPYSLPNTTVFVEEVATDNLYVDDDPNGDATPAMSIQTAVNFAAAGKTIFVEVGIFNERVTVDKSLTIDGAGMASSVLFGTGLPAGASGITINSGVTNVTIQDLGVTAFTGSTPGTTAGIYAIGGNNDLSLKHLDVSNNLNSSGVYIASLGGINNVMIDDVKSHGHGAPGNPARGIVIWDGLKSNITIQNCEVYNNNCCGIELQDGTATGVTLFNNNVHDNSDSGVSTTGLTGPGANLINMNTVTNNGRFGIEIKLPNGTGATSGPGSIVVQNNTVSRNTTIIPETRDIAGISVYRRAYVVGYNNVNIPTGVVVQNNTVSGYTQPSSSDGFGIVIEGTNHTVTGNTINNNDVGVQQQAGHTPYAENTNTDGDQSNLADQFFGRGNSPVACGNTITPNTFSGNTTSSRNVGPGVNLLAGVVVNDDTDETFCSIQAAADDSHTLSGHTINVDAGTYVENIAVTKSLNILGPNAAIDPNTGIRVTEAIVVPASVQTSLQGSTSGTIFRLGTTSHIDVTIKGLTIDGHNPNLAGGRTLNGVAVHTGAGIVNSIGSFDANPGGRDVKMTIQNNIIKNLERYGVLADGVLPAVALAGTDVSHNKIDNLPSGNNFGGGRGRAIAFEENHYGSATYNVISRVNVGWQDDNYYLASPGAGTLIDNNTISTYHRGIFHNLQYSNATPATISNNSISAATTGDFSASTTNFGVELASIQSAVGATVTNNNSFGNVYGILLWNMPTTANIAVSGGTLNNNTYGVYATNYDPQFADGSSSHAIISGVTISGATAAGVYVEDNPLHATSATFNLTVNNDCEIIGTGQTLTGVLVKGADASATVEDNDASIHGFAIGIDVDGGSATVDNNHIYDNGIGVRFTNSGTGTVLNNNFDGSPDNGVDVQKTSSGGLVTATPNNNFAGDTYGVENQSATNIDATLNYWSAVTGPGPVAFGGGTPITTKVLYCPWLNAAAPGGVAVGPVKNTATNLYYCTIQAAIDDSNTGNGDIITVGPGTYIENITVTKAVKLRGAQYGVSPNPSRAGAESIIVPAVSDPDPNSPTSAPIMYLNDAASGAEIDGFTFDGDNPSLTSAVNINGANIDAIEAIGGYDGLSNVTVSNNIIKNLNYAGIDFYNYSNGGASTTGNAVTNNNFDNILPAAFGIGVLIYNNCYTDITDNVMTRVRLGIQTGNFYNADAGSSHDITGNTIQSSRRGIYFNLHYSNSASFNISNNTFTNYAGEPVSDGIMVSSIQSNVGATISNNTVTGNTFGVALWNCPTTNTITITGCTLSGNKVGVFATNYYGPSNGDAASSAYALNGVSIQNSTWAGVEVSDTSSNTNGSTVSMAISGNTVINNTTRGLLIQGADASASFSGANAASFTGQARYIDQVSNGTNVPATNIDATAVSFDGQTGATATLAQNFAIEDKINHKIDDGALGFVLVKTNHNFVTANSFIAPATTAPNVQRGIDAAVAGFTVNVNSGTYTTALNINKGLKLYGLNSGISPVTGVRLPEATLATASGIMVNVTTTDLVEIKGLRMANAGGAFDHSLTGVVGTTITLEKNFYDNAIGVYLPNAVTTTIVDNLFTFNSGADEGFALFGNYNGSAGTHIDVHDNKWLNGQMTGMNLSSCEGSIYNNIFDNIAYYGVLVANLCDLDIYQNSFTGIDNPDLLVTTWGAGVRLYDDAAGAIVNIHNNTFDGNYNGISVRPAYDFTGTTLDVYDNSITNSTLNNIRNEGTGTLKAECNWFGSATDASIAATLFGPVDYNPWRTDGTDAPPLTLLGFQPTDLCTGTPVVITSAVPTSGTFCASNGSIDVDFTGGTAPFTISWSGAASGGPVAAMSIHTIGSLPAGMYTITVTDANLSMGTSSAVVTNLPVKNTAGPAYYATIQTAIDAATAGDVIEVCAGNYTENINISKALTINGPNVGTPGTGARSAEAVLLNCSIDINNAGNTTLDGFHIKRTDGTTGPYPLAPVNQIELDGGGTSTVRNCIFERLGSNTGQEIRAIATTTAGGPKVILNNKITGDATGGLFGGHKSWARGIYIDASVFTVTFTGNTIENCRTAMNVDDYNNNVSISGNTFNNSGTQISVGGATIPSGSFVMGANDFINNAASTMVNLSNVAESFRLNITSSTLNGTPFSGLTNAQLFEVEARMAHKEVSASKKGKVIYKANNQYVNNFTVPVSKIDKIQNSIKYGDANDIINLEDGTYNEKLTVDKPNLTLQGVTNDKTLYILDGTGVADNGSGAGSKSGIKINSGITNITIKDLTVQNHTGASGNDDAGIYGILSNNNLTITNVALLNNSTASGFYANGPIDNVSITNSMVTNNGGGARGIVIWNGMKTNIVITGNMVTNNVCCGIELQDGDASAVNVSGNTINIGSGDNAIGLVGLNPTVGANTVNGNIITGGGRFGIEIKNPAGGVTVNGNSVSLTTVNGDLRDRAGIAVFRRGVSGNNIDVPNGVTITGNTVTGYTQTLPEEGFGIVIEGTNHAVTGNIVNNCNIGIQEQGGAHANSYYPNLAGPDGPGNGAQGVGLSPNYFGRGNAPFACGNTIGSNTLSSNGTNTRTVVMNSYGLVTNTTSGEYFCNIQAGIDDAQTTNAGHTLQISDGVYAEDVNVTKANLTLDGQSRSGTIIKGLYAVGGGATLRFANTSADGSTAKDLTITRDYQDWYGSTKNYGVLLSGGVNDISLENVLVTGNRNGVYVENNGELNMTNSLIEENRTGLHITNTVRGNLMNNIIRNNQTHGIFYNLDDGVSDLTGFSMSDNTVYGNWYSQATFRGANTLGTPANLECNWWDTDAPTVNTSNPSELGYGALIPQQLGGTSSQAIYAGEFRANGAIYIDYTSWRTGESGNMSDPFVPTGICNGTPVVITAAIPDHIICGETDGSIAVSFSGGTAPYDIAWAGPASGSAMGVTSIHTIPTLPIGVYTITVTDTYGSIGTATATVQYLPVKNLTGPTYHATIQAAIDASAANDIIEVCAGNYVEIITVDKTLTLNGPNAAIDPCTGGRVPEAVIIPPTSQPFYDGTTEVIMMSVEAPNVTVKGFTFNGDNPAIATNSMGGAIDAADGLDVYSDVGGLTVQNNIFKNLNEGGVTGYPSGASSFGNNTISNNKFDNLPGQVGTGYPNSGYGIAVLIYNNFYADVEDNCMTNVRIGVQSGNYNLADPGNSRTIDNNTIGFNSVGIWHNLLYQNASTFEITNNDLTTSNNTTGSGLFISSIQNAVGVTVAGNDVTGAYAGIELWNNPTTNTVTVTGGAISNCVYGVFANNYDGYSSDAATSTVAISGVTVTGATTAGVYVKDNPSNSNNADITLIVGNDCEINGTGQLLTGILVEGSDAHATVQNNDASINGFAIGIDVNGGSATITGNHLYNNGIGVRFTNGGTGDVNTNKFYDAAPNVRDIQATASAGAVTATPNNWLAGSTFGVENLSGATIDATENFWNHASGPGLIASGSGAKVTTNVDYCPWLGDEPVAFGGTGLPLSSPAVTITVTETSGTTSNDGTICAGDNVTLNATIAGATAYLWSPGGAVTPSIMVTPGSNTLYTVTVTFADCQSTDDQQIIVKPLPSATITADAVVCGNSLGNVASVPNAGVGSAYVWSVTGGSITAGTGTNSITYTANMSGTITFNVTVTSPANCTSTGTLMTQIDNTPPAITCVGNQSVNTDAGLCTAAVNLIAPSSTNDNCPVTVTFAITDAGAIPANGNNDASGAVFNKGTSTVTYTITDGAGNTDDCSFTVTVSDAELPQITFCPANTPLGILDPRDPYATGWATATDNCAGVVVTYNDNRSGLTGCNATGTIVRTFTAKDASNNMATCVQTLTIQDLTPPVLSNCPIDMIVNADPGDCDAIVVYTDPKAVDVGYFQGFENAAFVSGSSVNIPSTDWNDYNSALSRVPSGTDGITSKTGAAHAVINSVAPPSGASGAFNRLGGFHSVFGTGFRSSMDIYIDLSDPKVVANTYGWDLSSAASKQDNSHLRDFIFHAAASAGQVKISASNNSNPPSPQIQVDNHTITSSGWYTFEWVFRDNAGALAVDLNLKDAGGSLLWTKTLSNPADLIASVVGGNRYMWFTFIKADKLAIDNSLLERNATVICALPSGTAFPVGVNTVTCTATDACSQTSNCMFDITVVDNQAPQVTCPPANVTINTNGDLSCEIDIPNYVNDLVPTDNCGILSEMQNVPYGANTSATHGQVIVVTYTATDIATPANSTDCTINITVNDDDPPVVTCPINQTVPPTLSSPCAAVVNSIDAMYNDNCSGSTLAYTLSDATTGSGSGQASGQTFLLGTTTVTYTVTDGASLTSSCMFTVTVTNCNITFAGKIEWSDDQTTGVNNATVNVTGASSGNDLSDVAGDYLVSAPYATGNFTLTPVKNTNKLNGVTVADATAIQQHIATTVPITNPYRQVAADVNKSNSITTFDATLINQALLGSPSALAQIKTSWRFVPQSYTLPLPPWGFPEKINLTGVTTNQTGQDFYGIKTGDLVTTFANPANFGAGEPLVLRVKDEVLEAGSELTVAFRTNEMNDLAAWQFALQFDPSQLQVLDIQPLSALPLTVDHFGTFNLAAGEIRSVWSQSLGMTLEESAPVFHLKFKVLQSGSKLSEVLELSDDILPGHVYTSTLAESGVTLEFYEVTGTGPTPGILAYRLLQNIPNPFVEKTNIGFVLPGACDATLRVFDGTGRLLREHSAWFAAGKNAVEFDFGTYPASGVLYYELTTPFGVLAKKMVVQRRD